MNKTCVLFALIAVLFIQSLSAQDLKITKSDNIIKGSKTLDLTIAGYSKDYIYVYRNLETNIEVFKFEKNTLNLKESSTLSLKLNEEDSKKKTPALNSVVVTKTNIIIFTSIYYKDEDVNHLFARSFDFDLKPIGEWFKVESITAKKSKDAGTFSISISRDSSKILVVKTEPFEKKGKEKLSFSVFDENLKKLVSENENLEYEDHKITIQSHWIAEDGTIYFIIKLTGDADNGFKIYRFVSTSENETSQTKFEFTLRTKNLKAIKFESNTTGDLLIAGFYSNPKSYFVDGVFSAWIMKSNQQPGEIDPFYSDSISAEMMGVYIIDKLVILPDKSFMMVTENRVVESRWVSDGVTGTSTLTTIYNENDIVYFKVSANGQIAEHYKLLKSSESKSTNNRYLSYFILFDGDNKIVFYNEHKKNFEPHKKRYLVPVKDVYQDELFDHEWENRVFAYATFINGNTTPNILLKEKEENYALMPRHALQISPGEVVLLGHHKKDYVLYKITVTN